MTDSQDDGDVILMLVAALGDILAYEGDDLPGPGTYGEEVYARARAAIAKALGRLSPAQKQAAVKRRRFGINLAQRWVRVVVLSSDKDWR